MYTSDSAIYHNAWQVPAHATMRWSIFPACYPTTHSASIINIKHSGVLSCASEADYTCETWRLDKTSISCCHDQRPRCGLVTDISLWIECFATLAAVLSVCYPDKALQFMAYMHTIVCASLNFEGPAWATYDMAFRRQAANRQSLDWGITHSTLQRSFHG